MAFEEVSQLLVILLFVLPLDVAMIFILVLALRD
jgi:hypothetical protein